VHCLGFLALCSHLRFLEREFICFCKELVPCKTYGKFVILFPYDVIVRLAAFNLDIYSSSTMVEDAVVGLHCHITHRSATSLIDPHLMLLNHG
jgi:hypothetical protein